MTDISGSGEHILPNNLVFPVTIQSTNTNPFIIKLDSDVTFNNTDNYFIIPSSAKNGQSNNVTIDGSGHVIICNSISSYPGLCRGSGTITLKNIGIDSSGITTLADYCGWFSSSGCNIDIQKCYTSGTISGVGSGGIVGANTSGTIDTCYSTGTISGETAGGIAGYYAKDLTIVNCYSIGEISGRGAGGIVGSFAGQDGLTELANCYSTGNLTGNESGGIAGAFAGYLGQLHISNCYKTGVITGTDCGGLVGNKAGKYGKCQISHCYVAEAGNFASSDNSANITDCKSDLTWTDPPNLESGWQRIAGHPWKLSAFLNLINNKMEQNQITLTSSMPLTPYASSTTIKLVTSLDVSASSTATINRNIKSIVLSNILPSNPLYLVQYNGNGTVVDYSNIFYTNISGNGELEFNYNNYLYPLTIQSTSSPFIIKFKEDLEECRFILPALNTGGSANTVTIDGSGHTVLINSQLYNNNIGYDGLVSSLSTNTIVKNIGVIGESNVNLSRYCGWVCSSGFRGSVIDCYSTGNIAEYGCGGIVGGYSTCNITGCYSSGTISSLTTNTQTILCGGIIGTNANGCDISACYSTGQIYSNLCGGIVAGVSTNNRISYCYSTGNINAPLATDVIDYGSSGIVGNFANGAIITGCYSTGSVARNCAGIAGYTNYTAETVVNRCYSTGTLLDVSSYAISHPLSLNTTVTNSLWTNVWSDDNGAILDDVFSAGELIWKSLKGKPWKLRRFTDNVTTTISGSNLIYTNNIPINSYGLGTKARLTGSSAVPIGIQKQLTIPNISASTPIYLEILDASDNILDYSDLINVNKVDVIRSSGEITLNPDSYYYPLNLISTGSPLTIKIASDISTSVQFYIPSTSSVIIDGSQNTVTTGSTGLVKSLSPSTIIKNINVSGSTLSNYCGWVGWGNQYVDGFKGTISNCTSTGTINSIGSGGIVGRKAFATVSKCGSTGIISGTEAGGIAGTQCDCSITGCYSIGAITGSSAGGIAGSFAGDVSVSTITGCYSTGLISGVGGGGIVGSSMGKVFVTQCYSTGNIIGVSGGGIIGNNFKGTVGDQSANIVSNCYSTGDISGATGGGGICGGDIGSINTCRIQSCYSTGAIRSTFGGGIVGNNTTSNCKVNSCFVTGTLTAGLNAGVFKPAGVDSSAVLTSNVSRAGWLDTSAATVLTEPGVWKRIFLNRAWKLNTFLNVTSYISGGFLNYESDFPLNSYPTATQARLLINDLSAGIPPVAVSQTTKKIQWSLLPALDISANQKLVLRLDTALSVVVDYANDFSYNKGLIAGSSEVIISDTDNYLSPITLQSNDSSSRLTIKLNTSWTLGKTFFIPLLSKDNSTNNMVTFDGSGQTVIPIDGYTGLIKSLSLNTIITNVKVYVKTGVVLQNNSGWIGQGDASGGFNGTVRNSSVSGEPGAFGTLIGINAKSFNIIDCYSTIGSIVGNGAGSVSLQSTIRNCYTSHNISNGGGIIGGFANYIDISSCYSTGNINIGSGGIAGQNCDSSLNISKCYSTGNIGSSAGGICGSNASCSISNCYITGNRNNAILEPGSIVGSNATSSCRITSCYAVSDISGFAPPGSSAIQINNTRGTVWSDASAARLNTEGDSTTWTNINLGTPWKLSAFQKDKDRIRGSGVVYLTNAIDYIYPVHIINTGASLTVVMTSDFSGTDASGTDPSFIIDSPNVTFDGSGHTITITGTDYVGLITSQYPSTIVRNVGVITSGGSLAVKTGWIGATTGVLGFNGTIDTCYSTGNILSNYCGGIVGLYAGNISQCTIRNCFSTGDIIGMNSGGIVTNGNCEITYCYSTGKIDGTSAGGIMGSSPDQNGTIRNCYSTGAITGNLAGGIRSYIYSEIITNCYVSGIVSGYLAGKYHGYQSEQPPMTDCSYSDGWNDDSAKVLYAPSKWWMIMNGYPWKLNAFLSGLNLTEGVLSNNFAINSYNRVTSVRSDNSHVQTIDLSLRAITCPPDTTSVALYDSSDNLVDYVYVSFNPNLMYGCGYATFPYELKSDTFADKLTVQMPFNIDSSDDYKYQFIIPYWSKDGTLNNVTFEGNGKTLKVSDLNYTGFIQSSSENTIIRNLTIESSGGTLADYAGWIGGESFKGTIIDCLSTAPASSFGSGGMVGANSSCLVKNSIMTGEISGQYAGGFIGYNSIDSTVFESHCTGIISGLNAGGIMGGQPIKFLISSCYSLGLIDGVGSGGILGAFSGNKDDCQIKDCYATGHINGAGNGGIIGTGASNRSGQLLILNCYSAGDISGTNTGGIVGAYGGINGNITIQDCFSTGNNSGGGIMGAYAGYSYGNTGNFSISYCYSMGNGGLIGTDASNGTITKCYSKGVINYAGALNSYGYTTTWSDISATALMGLDSHWKSIKSNEPWKLAQFLIDGNVTYQNGTFRYERKFPLNAYSRITTLKLQSANPSQNANLTDTVLSLSGMSGLSTGTAIYLIGQGVGILDYIDILYEPSLEPVTMTNVSYLPPCFLTAIYAVNYSNNILYIKFGDKLNIPVSPGVSQELVFEGKSFKFTETTYITVSRRFGGLYSARTGDIEFTVTFLAL